MALRTDLTDNTLAAAVHADQHNQVNGAVLVLQAPNLNVKDFGARGDGVTDDTAAINAALAAASASASTARVVLPKGTYLCNTTSSGGHGAYLLGPPAAVNGLALVGAGVGQSIIKTTYTGQHFMLYNQGNDTDWRIEGIELRGPGAGTVSGGATVNAGTGAWGLFGASSVGFFANFANFFEMRLCKISGCNVGLLDYAGKNNMWDVWCRDNRNVGTWLVTGLANVVRGLNQVQNPSNTAGTGEVVANICFANANANDGGSMACRLEAPLVDEIGLNGTGGGSGIYIASGADIEVTTRAVYGPGKKQGANNPYYGIRIGALSVRTHINGTRVEPYTVDAIRVPDHTILVEAGATDTVLMDVTTNPNVANGGGDILDLGTRTVYRNVRLNDGPSITSIASKAGVPADGDYQVAPPVGAQVLDTTDGKIYYRTAAATWRAATLT
jgi:hypothetical protein